MASGLMEPQLRLRQARRSHIAIAESSLISGEEMSTAKGAKQKMAAMQEGKELQTDARISGANTHIGLIDERCRVSLALKQSVRRWDMRSTGFIQAANLPRSRSMAERMVHDVVNMVGRARSSEHASRNCSSEMNSWVGSNSPSRRCSHRIFANGLSSKHLRTHSTMRACVGDEFVEGKVTFNADSVRSLNS